MRNLAKLLGQMFLGLRFRLLLLIVLTCTPLIILTLNRAGEDRRRAVLGWRQRAARMMQSASREEEKLMGESRQLLIAMTESSSVRSGNRRNSKKLVDELYASYPRYANLGVISTNGEILASAAPVISKSATRDREFFQRVLDTAGFVIGEFPAQPFSARPSVNFGYPVFDRSGQPTSAVFAALDLSWFNRFGSELPADLPKGATWTEISRDGTILARYPVPKDWVGRQFPDPNVLKTIVTSREGTVEEVDASGVPTFYTYAPMQNQLVSQETFAILETPKEILFSSADRALARNLTWLTAAAALAIALGWIGSNFLIVRPVKALVHSSTQLAMGDLTTRTGLRHGRDELGRLTLAFDLMAQALEQRELERNRASHKLQALSHRLVEVQESERRSIARELHDEIGQSLTVAELNLHAALENSSQAALSRRLEESIQAVGKVLEQVHDLSLNLRPSMLDDLGLESALRWYTNRQASLTGLQSRFRADPLERRIDPIIETECFRVAQEALTNVVRHSRAREVAVELRRKDGHLHLSVKDDGVGFDVNKLREKAVRGASLGLLSMEERAALAGGGLEYLSSPGHGTEVHAWFPIKWRAEDS
jgi:signal transduction histidine kinase